MEGNIGLGRLAWSKYMYVPIICCIYIFVIEFLCGETKRERDAHTHKLFLCMCELEPCKYRYEISKEIHLEGTSRIYIVETINTLQPLRPFQFNHFSLMTMGEIYSAGNRPTPSLVG